MMPRHPPVLTLPVANPQAALCQNAMADAEPGAEWLVTDGLGGYACGAVQGPATRRYHGWFVPHLDQPRGRHVLLPRLDDSVVADDGAWLLDAHLASFRLEGSLPVWRYELPGRVIERSVVMPHGRQAMAVRWRLLQGAACRLLIRPFVAARRPDEPLPADERPHYRAEDAEGGSLHLHLETEPGLVMRLHTEPGGLPFQHDGLLDPARPLVVEQRRGYDHAEHQHSPGHWTAPLVTGRDVALCASLQGDAPLGPVDSLFRAEHDRQALLLMTAGLAERPADEDADIEARLVLAADAFIVRPLPRSGGNDALVADAHQRSVIAGYPWFTDWGRDTMIALEGLTLATGRHAEARAILHTYAGYLQHGLLPNLFPDGGREGLYHTVDATLWFFHALDRYTIRSGDDSLVPALYPALREVVQHHVRGTRFGIGVDPQDGLLRASADGYQLTWMDAKLGDWVVTPRRGKPVEIQALWFNALRLMADWAQQHDLPDDGFDAMADRLGESFHRRFWSAGRGHLLDVLDGPDGDDASLRPNQVFSLSLSYPVLQRPLWRPVLDTVQRELLTPFGLRTLGPREQAYQPRYEGDLRSRDAAYHQGTVWPWLLGHFIDAWLREHADLAGARAWLAAFPNHLRQAGIGQVSEVFDGSEPQRPEGCFAQAWSVAELLRAWQATRRPAAAVD